MPWLLFVFFYARTAWTELKTRLYCYFQKQEGKVQINDEEVDREQNSVEVLMLY